MAEPLRKLADCDFPLVRSWLDFEDGAGAIVNDVDDASDALDLLEQRGFLIEAAQVVAHALPRRESVWWACLCADDTAPPDLPTADRLAREAAEHWVRYHTDLLRRHAMDQAEATRLKTPEAWTAVAAFWSEGSLAPLGKPTVKPSPDLTGKAVSAAIRLSAARGDMAGESARLRLFLSRARVVAKGEPGRSAEETFTTGRLPDPSITAGLSADETVSVAGSRRPAN